MPERLLLLVASQCDAYGDSMALPGLDDTAKGFYDVMVDPQRGDCRSALDARPGLLIDATVDETVSAIREAFYRAAQSQAHLLFGFLGHGIVTEQPPKFYFLPKDANPQEPDAHHALSLIEVISEQWGNHYGVTGLLVLVDTCSSGDAAIAAADQWVPRARQHYALNFELLAAAQPQHDAYNACFTRTLFALIGGGDPTNRDSSISCALAAKIVRQRCAPEQIPQHLKFAPGEEIFLARNVGVPDKRWGAASEIIFQHLTFSQPTHQLAEVGQLSRDHRCVAYLGGPGVGKTHLAAALTRYADPAAQSELFVHAIVLLRHYVDMEAFAKDLSTQFVCNLGGAFAEAIRSFSLATPDATEAQLPEFERRILGPLTRLKPGTSVRIVLDGLDSLATKARTELLRFLNKLLDDPLLARVRLVVTASSEQELPNGAKIIRAPEQAERETLERYLLKRNCSEQDVPFILDQSQGNWLVAKFLANKASCAAEGITCIAVQRNLDQFWDHMLEERQVGAAPRLAKEPMAQIVCILAAAGRGPLLPVCLLLETSRRLGAVGDMKDLRDYLARLNDILVRVSPGTSEERVGLFHSRLVEFVVDKKYKKSVAASRDVIIQVLEEHAGETEAVKRFAIEHEPDLFLAQNRPEEALASVRHWDGEIRRRGENLNRWRAWKDSFAEKLTDRHPCTLSVRAELAERLGKCGQEKRAWTELNEVLKLQISAYGDDRHFEALKTRHYLTHWIGPSVGSEHALSHALRLLPDEFMALGANARDVFKTRHNIAYWEGQSGDRRKAREDFKNLLRDEERDPSQGLGKTDPDTLRTRHGFAFWTGICGNAKEALRLFQELLADQEATQGAEDVETLKTRDNVAHWTGHVGKHEEACKLYESLLPLRKRVLGSDDPDTLRTRRSIAFWKGRSGRVLEALQESLDLLEDLRSSPIEHTHEDTLRTLEHVALWTGITGSPSEALTLADGVRKSWEQKRCADHPDLFFVRHLIAYLQMARGNAKEAFEEAERLLADMKRDYCELAERHPDTMLLRHNIARWVGQTGDPCRATELLKAVADDREKVLGGEHPDTLETKYYVMFWQMQCVDSKNTLDEAARMRDLLAQQDTSLNLGPYAPLKIRLRVFLESLERFGATSKGSSP